MAIPAPDGSDVTDFTGFYLLQNMHLKGEKKVQIGQHSRTNFYGATGATVY